ncbi:DNA primase [bacterium]|nr:DNA primase [candidate division CSSED10-310 bacterium]
MSGRIPDSIIDEIKEKIDAVRLIGEYVPLKRAGRLYRGFCPFHKEKTPSFFVNPEWKIFKCYGCGENGNIFTFLMKYEGLTFLQSVERLARIAGVLLPDPDPRSQQQDKNRDTLHKIMTAAHRIFKSQLMDQQTGRPAREYLKKRGFDTRAVQKFGIGFACNAWDALSTHPGMKGFSIEDMETAGLLVVNPQKNSHYDRFRNRIIFPIKEHREGRLIAFGGRTLGDDPAKYINTPETPLYHKSRTLYGLLEAIQSIRKRREVIVVEGYFDQIAMVRAGILHTVATCGTALSQDHVRLLKQSADKIFLLFDPDTAGVAAACRALEQCLAAGVDAVAVQLPEKKDPDDIIRDHGRSFMEELLDRGLPALDFLIRSSRDRHDMNTGRGRRNTVQDMVPFLAAVENSIDRGIYMSRIAELIGIPDTSVVELYRRSTRRQAAPGRTGGPGAALPGPVSLDSREKDLFCLLLLHPEIIEQVGVAIPLDSMITETGKALYHAVLNRIREETSTGKKHLMSVLTGLEDPNIRSVIAEILTDSAAERKLRGKPQEAVNMLSRDFKKNRLKMLLTENRRKIRETGPGDAALSKLLAEQLQLVKDLRKLNAGTEELE